MAIENGHHVSVRHLADLGAMGSVTLVVVEDKVVELVALVVFLFDLPIKERAKWVPLHEAIEQVVYLLRLPDELALNRGKHDLVAFDFAERVRDGDCCLIGHVGSLGCGTMRISGGGRRRCGDDVGLWCRAMDNP